MYLAGVMMRQHRRWRDTVLCRGAKFRIEAEEPVPFQVDGDPGGFLPLEIEVVPRRLHMLVPRAWAIRQKLLAPGAAPDEPREMAEPETA
jgi:diacylglycerol kinase family enzyme